MTVLWLSRTDRGSTRLDRASPSTASNVAAIAAAASRPANIGGHLQAAGVQAVFPPPRARPDRAGRGAALVVRGLVRCPALRPLRPVRRGGDGAIAEHGGIARTARRTGPAPAHPAVAPRAPSRPLPDAQPRTCQRVPQSVAAAPRAVGAPSLSSDVVSALSSDRVRRRVRSPSRPAYAAPARPGSVPEGVDADEEPCDRHPFTAHRPRPDPGPGPPGHRVRLRAPAGAGAARDPRPAAGRSRRR